MNEHLAAETMTQLCANKFFPGAIAKYLEDTELADLSGDALILLVNIFKFINALCGNFWKML